jgi:hypothetical protein
MSAKYPPQPGCVAFVKPAKTELSNLFMFSVDKRLRKEELSFHREGERERERDSYIFLHRLEPKTLSIPRHDIQRTEASTDCTSLPFFHT